MPLRKELFASTWFILAFVSAVRYGVGSDYFSYVYAFEVIGTGINDPVFQSKEFLYRKVVELIYAFGGGAEHVFIVYSVFTHIFFYFGCRNYFQNYQSRYLFTVLYFTLFYFYTMIGIRQALSASMVFYLSSLRGKNAKYFSAIISISAVGVHYSALVPLLLVLLTRLQRTVYSLSTFSLSIILLSLFFVDVSDYIQSSLKMLGLPYHWYFEMEEFKQGAGWFSRVVTGLSAAIFLVLRGITKRRCSYPPLIDLMLVSFLATRILSLDLEIFGRLAVYFKPFIIVFIIYTFNELIKRRLAFAIMVSGAYCFAILGIVLRGLSDITFAEYATIF